MVVVAFFRVVVGGLLCDLRRRLVGHYVHFYRQILDVMNGQWMSARARARLGKNCSDHLASCRIAAGYGRLKTAPKVSV